MNQKRDFKFDTRASRYDGEFEGKLSRKFYNLVTENIEVSNGFRILDVGCGTGTILKRISDKYEILGTGIDIENKMLEIAKSKCPNLDIRLCSCVQTPFDDASFDIIIACMAYHHFADKSKFAKEAARLLKRGGKLYISDPKFPYPIRKLINIVLSTQNIAGDFFTADEIITNFTPFGFSKVETKSDFYAQLVIMERK